MPNNQFIYTVNYPIFEEELCVLETKVLFDSELYGKAFWGEIAVNPAISPFLRNRLTIMYSGATFADVLQKIRESNLSANQFMVKYLKIHLEDPSSETRRACCKEIGLIIEGEPAFKDAQIVYGITFFMNKWYFGTVLEVDPSWKWHNNKPWTYSSSIGITTAKVLVNLAGKGDVTKKLIDPCCGVGTVLLEGVFAGYAIQGWELNPKIAEDARRNLKYFDYEATVVTGDMKDIEESFDTAIVDLPYGNFSKISQEEKVSILQQAKRISSKMVIVSAEDITEELKNENLKLTNFCKIGKGQKLNFLRYVWMCECMAE